MHRSNSTEAQRQRILEHLKCGSITTLQARSLGIMHPGMRVCELRRQGYDIVTEMAVEYCPGGVLHRIAKYVLRQAGKVVKK